MSSLSDFIGGGGGLTPKFEEFNSSGTFTPSQALIDAGGYIEVFLVAGGGRGFNSSYGGSGGEVLMKKMYLTSTTGCTVTIGAGATSQGGTGGNSSFTGSSAGGVDLTSLGGIGVVGGSQKDNTLGAAWGAQRGQYNASAGSGVLGYSAGGAVDGSWSGVKSGKPNSGQGSYSLYSGGSGYCLIKWYE
jgi:hypothetical protein